MKMVRRFVYQANIEYFENGAGRVEMRESEGSFAVEFLNTDRLTVGYAGDYEFIPRPFAIAPGVTVPVGGYNYQSGQVSYFLHNDAAHVRQCALTVQLERQDAQHQRTTSMGVSARQRAVRGLQRRTRHRGEGFPRALESSVRRQDQSPAAVLTEILKSRNPHILKSSNPAILKSLNSFTLPGTDFTSRES